LIEIKYTDKKSHQQDHKQAGQSNTLDKVLNEVPTKLLTNSFESQCFTLHTDVTNGLSTCIVFDSTPSTQYT